MSGFEYIYKMLESMRAKEVGASVRARGERRQTSVCANICAQLTVSLVSLCVSFTASQSFTQNSSCSFMYSWCAFNGPLSRLFNVVCVCVCVSMNAIWTDMKIVVTIHPDFRANAQKSNYWKSLDRMRMK